MAKWIAESGPVEGLELSFKEGAEWIVGRDPDASQLVVDDTAVSRTHCIVRKSEEGFSIENISETNPLLVNDGAVESASLLQEGDVVSIGNTKFRHIEEAEQKEETPEEEHPEHESVFEEEPLPTGPGNISFSLQDSSRWLLKVVGGPNSGAEFALQTGAQYRIGTDPHTCDVIFHDTSVSREHARIAVDDQEVLFIEDLGSRNGSYTDGEKIEGRRQLASNTLITMGTTSFVVYDREGKMQTIISPLLPSIVKTLQEKEKEKKEPEPTLNSEEEAQLKEVLAVKSGENVQNAVGAFILIGILTGLFVIIGLSVTSLFQGEEVEQETHKNAHALIAESLSAFPDVQFSFNKNSGQLLLVGHVLRIIDKNQILYNLNGLDFIRSVDDTGLVIDEYVWREINSVLAKTPLWKGIIVRSPAPGEYVIEGYLKTRAQSEQLSDYLSSNFPYLDRLERRVVVLETLINSIKQELHRSNIRKVQVQISDGEVSFTGAVPSDKIDEFKLIIAETEKIPGVRRVRNFTTQMAPQESMINITDRYEVNGFSSHGNKNSVVIDGKILMEGDIIDGMRIAEIKPGRVLLNKDGVIYRIDFK